MGIGREMKLMNDERLYTCEVRFMVYKGRTPKTMKPTGKFAHRPPFIVREHEVNGHVFGVDSRRLVHTLGVGEQANLTNHTIWKRLR